MSSSGFDENHQPVRVAIISGLSGSGKSTAIRALEDIGFFCIDNLPIVLLPKVTELFPRTPGEIEQIALVVDAREGSFLDDFKDNVDRIRNNGSRVEVMYLECSDKVLLRRYHETRRRHPLAQETSVEDGIVNERGLLKDLKESSDKVIETSDLNPHQLRQIVQDYFVQIKPGHEMNLTLVSFGYKFGIPAQSDLVFDVRFLPNPYFVPHLRALDGTDKKVSRFVLEHEESKLFLKEVAGYLTIFRPYYDREGKSYLTVGIGCTGGRHRSVAIVEELGRRLAEAGQTFVIRHREIEKPKV